MRTLFRLGRWWLLVVVSAVAGGCGGGSGSNDPTGTLSASPESCVIPVGGAHCSSTLAWSSTDADTACLFTGSGERLACGLSGSHEAADIVAGTNTFVLKDDDSFDGSTLASVDVTGIYAPWVAVSFDPSTIVQGETSTLTWASDHTDSCTGIPGSDTTATSGTQAYAREEIGDWTVTVTCEGPGGEASDSATLTVRRPPNWTLSDDQRRAYLSYYSPIIFKRSNEDGHDQRGLDLVTHFDFDQDDVFSNNKRNWEQVYRYVEGHRDVQHWRIRPTLYTGLIEFMEADQSKSLIMLYHVYHAKQVGSIHDWERVEIRIDDAYGRPGQDGERLNYVVITNHRTHKARKNPDADLNFMQTPTGKHALIWQAQWSGSVFETNRAELRFVEDAWPVVSARVEAADDAEVEVIDTGDKKNVNYVFVCDCSSAATDYWGAQAITGDNARALTAGVREQVEWDEVPRVTYELQDLADILPTHTAAGGYQKHWKFPFHTILLESPIRDENGVVEQQAGWDDFYYFAIDDEDPGEDREGYPYKGWFWGAYDWGGHRSMKLKAYTGNTLAYQGGTRGSASGRLDSHRSYWWQHDYFAHSGQRGPEEFQYGRWLALDWYTAEKGGFDGRWVQLFAD